MKTRQEIGSYTAIGGFNNEREIASKLIGIGMIKRPNSGSSSWGIIQKEFSDWLHR